MAAHASATFWLAGAIQAAVAGSIGGLVAIVAWFVGIPVISGVLVVIGGFMVVMAAYTFIHEGRGCGPRAEPEAVTARRLAASRAPA